MSRVIFAETEDREQGVKNCLDAFDGSLFKGKDVLIKPNFNTADTAPGSTHNDTLLALVNRIWDMGARSLALGERSYPLTRDVMEKKGVLPLLEAKEVKVINFDELDDKDWMAFKPNGGHWPEGFKIARPILDAECLVSTGCLKTHQFGGVFTLSLKLHVGVVPTSRHGYQYMGQLHSSPHQQQMIAEINKPFSPDLIVMDGIDTFVDGGPMSGKRMKGNVFLASDDRVAIDAAGVAVLKELGSNSAIMDKKIFDQPQIARAVELGLGVESAEDVLLEAVDPQSRTYCDRVLEQLRKG